MRISILDRYVAVNFIIGYIIAFGVLIGMRIMIDLFVNLDEFVEHSELGTLVVVTNILRFYGYQSFLYFRDFAGMITVVAAAFSLARLTRNNELIAVLASGVSLKRVMAPIIVMALLLTGLLVADQEIFIPRSADKLVRDHDDLPGQESYQIWFMEDNKHSLLCTIDYSEREKTLREPTIIMRTLVSPGKWQVMGKIQAEKAVYNEKEGGWDLIDGEFIEIRRQSDDASANRPIPVYFYKTDIKPADIPQRRQEGYKSLLSSSQLTALARQGTRIKDLAELYSQKHFRITDPIINMAMLLISLPILVRREPRTMKTAIAVSFSLTAACFIVTFVCKMMATEVILQEAKPEIWAWIPVFIFVPLGFFELDMMKT